MLQPNASAAALPAHGGVDWPAKRRESAAGKRPAAWKRLELLGLGLGTEISTDLGDSIGSRDWWFGLCSCLALCASAIALATMVAPIPALTSPGMTQGQRDMLRPQTISPLATGGTTGARVGPSTRLVEALAEAPERPRLELTSRINGRDSVETLLRRAGVGGQDIGSVIPLIGSNADIAALPRADLNIVLGRRASKAMPRPLESLSLRAAFDLRLVVERIDGVLQVRRVPIAVDSTPLRVKGSVGGSLERALRSAGIPAGLANEFIKTMGYAVDFQHGVGRKDKFDIVVERDAAETGEIRYGNLLFAGLERAGKDLIELGRFDAGGKGQFFRASGESARKGLMRTPVDGARLTSGFGMRFHPLLSYSRMHQGIDFGASSGSPILAAATGKIAFAGPHGGHGNYVLIKHNKELSTGYAHMSRFAVRAGQSVTQGQVIGYVGSTGLSTGPHLHYEVWLRNAAVNPIGLKFIGGSELSGRNLDNFLSMMNRMRALGATGSAVAAADAVARRGRRTTRLG